MLISKSELRTGFHLRVSISSHPTLLQLLLAEGLQSILHLTVPELTRVLPGNSEGSRLSVAVTFRGQISIREVDEYISRDPDNN